ncbi:hypothetical protein NDU88_000699 [Pleurodeles waltl]|uniref:Uncharacterized protein n=1 Tax=Pleurodeles waltl TaxID=8319 RepID=A0AAV7MIA2_PLEWA|nr:hypothetical protein NDU88_000699 [Pleurodeles waltl]
MEPETPDAVETTGGENGASLLAWTGVVSEGRYKHAYAPRHPSYLPGAHRDILRAASHGTGLGGAALGCKPPHTMGLRGMDATSQMTREQCHPAKQ